ncbi:hypothetical protein C1N80_06195 [Brachybacterium sp. SGAir0954]|nr:hypothetical protein C1N80_06195 [Brachybacterium sp. SGAir0954]
MDFSLRIAEATIRGQQLAESLMVDELRLDRPTGRTVRVDGDTVPEMETVWSGRGKVQSQQSYPSQPESGGGTSTLATFEVHIPASETVTVLVDDVFVVDSSRDGNLAGARFRVRVDPVKSWRTARRFNCEEIVA